MRNTDANAIGEFEEEDPIAIDDHECKAVVVPEDGTEKVKYECVDCGHLSNAVTGFAQTPCGE